MTETLSSPVATHLPTVSRDRLRLVEGWGMVSRSMGYVYRPSTPEGVLATLDLARRSGLSVVPRGTGYSYGDASLNAENLVLDLTRMARILEWDAHSGRIRLEPGVTVRALWEYVLEDGWWPPVVPGAMYPTMGGCVSTNVHGKNHWRAGAICEHIHSLDLLLPSGEMLTCGPGENREVFDAVSGGLGMLGVVTSVTLQLDRIASGLLRVREVAASHLADMFDIFERNLAADELVGWIDAFGRGNRLGRGLVQIATRVRDDPEPSRTLQREYQLLPDTFMGFLPRSGLWRAMKPMVNDSGMRLLNDTRYRLGSRSSGRVSAVPHAQFHFFHDFVPNWKRSFFPLGIVQYQVFVPERHAREVCASLLETSHSAGLIPYLAVFKRHRVDPSLLRYGVDGYSLSLDYHATEGNHARLRGMLERCTDHIVLPADGRFYPAKDSVLSREAAWHSFTPSSVHRFLALKERLDPESVLQSDLFRRLFAQ